MTIIPDIPTPSVSIPTYVGNHQSATTSSGVDVYAPLVALAYSYALLTIDGGVAAAGKRVTVECGDDSVTVTLNDRGAAELSLLPFIRAAVLANGALEAPLYMDAGKMSTPSPYRGLMSVGVTDFDGNRVGLPVWYIFGNFSPALRHPMDYYYDFDPYGETYCPIDIATNYAVNGEPLSDFDRAWVDVNQLVSEQPTGDFVMVIPTAHYNGNDAYSLDNRNFHFRYDCRTTNVIKLRWLDTNGGINSRKFTKTDRSRGAAAANQWQRQHAFKEVDEFYDRGSDTWADISATETLKIGDDGIAIRQFDWLKSLVSSPAVEAKFGNTWTRVQVSESSMTCDERRSVFSMSLTLVLPVDDVQQF